MSELYTVSCPHCGASGQLSDPALKGTAIYCPACSKAFVIPAATSVATVVATAVPAASPIAPPVAAVAPPAAVAVPVAAAVVQPAVTPLAVGVAVPVAQAVVPGSSPPIATAIPAIPMATASAIPPTVNAAPIDFPNISGFQTDALTPTAASKSPARRPSKPQSPRMDLLKVVLLSIVSAVSLFGIVVLSQKTPRPRSASEIASTTRKPKKSSRRKTASAAPKPASETRETMPEEMPDTEEIKPLEPELKLATATPAAPKMEKPAAPPPAAPQPAPQPTVPGQTIENIPADVNLELDNADDKKDLPALIALLSHAHAGVRERAAECLYRIDVTPDLVQPLSLRLADSYATVRKAAIKALAKHGLSAHEVIPALGKSLQQDADSGVRWAAADSLAVIATGDPERSRAAAEPLLAALDRNNGEELFAIIAATGSLGEAAKPGIPTLLQFAKDPRLGEPAVGALAQLGHFESFPPILAGTDSTHLQLKQRIAEGLRKLRPMTPAALTIIKTLSEDKDKTIRAEALQALLSAEPKLEAAISLLERAQSDPERDVRDLAARGIGLYESTDPERKMRSLLTQMVKSENEIWSSSKIATAMMSNKVEGFGALVGILTNPESTPELRTVAGQVLAMSRLNEWYDTKHIDKLKKLFDDPEQSLTIRTGCAIALLSMKETDPRLGVTVLQVVTDPSIDLRVRAAAVYQVPREQPGLLPALIAAAGQCVAPAPEGASQFELDKRVDFYTNVLGAMEQFKAEEDQLQLNPHLVAAIRQPHWLVKISAMSVTQRLGNPSPEIIEALRETLRANSLKVNNQYVRETVFETIGKLHRFAAAALPDLRAALQSESRDVRSSSVGALREFGPAAMEAVPDLITALLGDEKKSAAYVGRALAAIAPQNEAVLAAIIQSLDRPDLREDGVEALQDMGPAAANAVPVLRKLLAGDMPELRREILEALGKIGEAAKPAIPDIVLLLADPAEDVRGAAAAALGDLQQHALEAVPDLVKLLNDPVEDVQFRVVYALERIGPAAKAAIPELEKYLAATKSDQMKRFAGNVLAKLQADPGDADPVLFSRLLDDTKWEELSRNQAAQLELSIPELAKLCRNKSHEIRQRAESLLTDLGRQPAGQALLEGLLNGTELRDQALAATLLKKWPAGGPSLELAQALVPWIEAEQIRYTAAHMLTRIGSPANPVIAAALNNDKLPEEARRSLMHSIQSSSTFNKALLLPLLQPVLKAENLEQRRVAALAILELFPRDIEALPIVLESLSSDDVALQSRVRKALVQSAMAEVDVRAAIPAAVATLAKHPTDLTQNSYESYVQHSEAFYILTETGARPEDVPPLQESLAKLAAPKDLNGQPLDKLNSNVASTIKTFASQTIEVLGTIGAPAAAALPEIRQILAQGHGFNDEECVRRYAQGIAGIGEPAIEMVIELVKQPDAHRGGRQLAIQVLGRIGDGDQRTTAILTEFLKDPDVEMRVSAARILAEQPATLEVAVPILAEGLSIERPPGEENDPRYQLINQLRDLKTKAQSAVPALLGLSKQEKQEERLRLSAVQTLLQISPDSAEVQAAYLDCLKTLSESGLSSLLGRTEDLPAPTVTGIVTELTRMAEDPVHPRRAVAIRLLGTLKDKAAAALPALRGVVSADQGPVGIAATIAVARIDPTAKDLVPRLAELFEKNRDVRSDVGDALRLQGPNVAPVLPTIIQTCEKHRGWSGIEFSIIGRMGPEAKPELPRLLKELLKSENFSYTAIDALKELGSDAAELWPQLLTSLQANDDLPAVVRALSQVGGDPARDAVAVLQKLLTDDQRRLAAVQHLAVFEGLAAPAVPELIKFAAGDDFQLRLATLQTLAAIGPDAKEAAATVVTLLADSDPQVAGAAANTLVDLRAAALPVLPQVIAALEKPRRCTQWRLISWLQEMGPAAKDAIPTLTKLRAAADLRLRHQVRLALEKIEAPAEAKAP